MISSLALTTLRNNLNHFLSLDPEMSARLCAFEGKVLLLRVKPVELFILFTQGQVELLSEAKKIDTTLTASPLSLLKLGILSNDKSSQLFKKDIQIDGDVQFGHAIKRCFDAMEIDWEEHLSRITGDVIAHQLGNTFRQSSQFAQHVGQSMQQNLTDYLQEEIHLLPPREALEDFFNDVDDLRLAADRLEAKLDQFLRQANTQ